MRLSALHNSDERGTLLNLKGQVVSGRFQILNLITCGSYAEIYLAHNLSPKNDEPDTVIIKVLNMSLQGELDPAMERTLLENMELEALTLSRFRHGHIVRLYECGTGLDERTGRQFYYLALEHMAGGDLFRLCRANPLPIEQVLEYARQICDALSYAHAHNTAHRDVKPNNILLSADKRTAKLLDFGTARLLDRDNGLITRVGTAIYSAPEHYSQNQTTSVVTPAADVYSLAKTILFLLTGESPVQLSQRQVTSLPAQLNPMPWANSLLYVLRKATCDRPEDRYQSAQDFYRDLCDVTELTFVGPRFPKEKTPLREVPRGVGNYTRIEVPVTPLPPSDYGAVAARLLRLVVEYSKKIVVLGAAFRVIRIWSRPWLRRVATAISQFVNWLRKALRAMPQKVVVRILAVIIITVMLLVVSHHLLNWWRALPVQESTQKSNDSSLTGKEATTSTDVNIRSGPAAHERKIGLAERASRVRILSSNAENTWCEIEVLQHGRPKKEPNSADRGWVNKKYLDLE